MTVAELRAVLADLPDNMPVVHHDDWHHPLVETATVQRWQPSGT